MRFDFSHPEKVSPEQIAEIENIVNEAIKNNYQVICEEMPLEEAKTRGAMGVFDSKYGEKVKVYTVGYLKDDFGSSFSEIFSSEICGGPHVKNTGILGNFKVKKEEASSSGVRRIKAILEN